MRGTLTKKFPVEPLLQVLGNHRSTGKLIIMHPVRGRFAAYLENGRLVHAEYGEETGVDALATLINVVISSFSAMRNRRRKPSKACSSLR
jgi:Domain of unknown function (DUF4388)